MIILYHALTKEDIVQLRDNLNDFGTVYTCISIAVFDLINAEAQRDLPLRKDI